MLAVAAQIRVRRVDFRAELPAGFLHQSSLPRISTFLALDHVPFFEWLCLEDGPHKQELDDPLVPADAHADAKENEKEAEAVKKF